jgi:prepilin peptidase CpaA
MSVAIALTLAGCLAASYYDIRARRIPNALTGSLAVSAVIVHAFGGVSALAVSLSVMAGLMILGSVVYSFGGIGGGDIKLAVAASGMLSYPLCISFLLYTAIGGGLLAICFLIFRGEARSAFSRIALVTAGAARSGSVTRTTLPYAVAFAFGATAILLSQNIAPFLRLHFS